MTTDVLVEGRHFRLDWISARDLGRRAIAQNLADVAAMGARPTAVIVALTIPGDVSIGWLEDLAAGMGAETAAAGADRKSTRLNSSHVATSYAVVCLTKKKEHRGGGSS